MTLSSERFTIEVQTPVGEQSTRRLIGQFDDDAWGALLGDLGLTPQRIDDWRNLQPASDPLVREYPQVSRLSFIDEGKIKFTGVGIRELSEETARLGAVASSSQSRRLLALIGQACNEAGQENSSVIIHQFGWSERSQPKDQPVANPPLTVEVRAHVEGQDSRRLIGQSAPDVFDWLLKDLKITDEQLVRWSEGAQDGGKAPLIPEYPNFSALFDIVNKYVIRFTGIGASALGDESARLEKRVGSDASRQLVALLEEASRVAQLLSGEIVVHPFGWPDPS